MANNPYVNKVELADGTTLIDLSSDTITPGDLLAGVTAHDRSGAVIVGTLSIVDSVYPVGSIYMSVASTSPATLFGGTWAQLKDRFLLGAGDTYEAGNTGGNASVSYTPAGKNTGGSVGDHTLTTSEIPSHAHGLNSHKHSVGAHSHGLNSHTHTGPSHTHSVGAHSHGLNSHKHSVGAHAHGLNSHKHSVGAHSHGLNSHTHSIPALSGTAASSQILLDYSGSYLGNASGYRSLSNSINWADTKGANSYANYATAHTHSVTTVANTSGQASGSTANSTAFDSGAASGSTANSTAFDSGAASGSTANSTAFDSGAAGTGNTGAASGSTANSTAFDSGAASGNTASAGGGGAHGHGFTNPTFTGTAATITTMPPYLVVYMWKRTA